MDLFLEGMWNTSVLKVEVFALQAAFDQVVRVVNKQGEEFGYERGKEEQHRRVLSVSQCLLKVSFEEFVTREVYEAANHRPIEHSRETS